MPKSWKTRQRRKADVKQRAGVPSHMFKNCRVIGCKKLARAASEDGLDTRFCRSHADHYARHGSPYKRSYTAAEINPYRRAAMGWLLAHDSDRWVANALQRVEGLYGRAGPHVEAFRLRGLSPRERANVAWARLRHHKVDPRIVVAAWLAVEAVTRDDPKAERKREFKQVQAAKLVHRLASGSHKRWTQERSGVRELHVYPPSRGKVLRYLGKDLEAATELLVEQYLFAVERRSMRPDRQQVRAVPRSVGVRSRSAR